MVRLNRRMSTNVPMYVGENVSDPDTAQPGRIIFSSGRGKFSLFLSSKISFGFILMSFIRGEIVLGILKWYGCVGYQFMLGCQIDGK